MSPSIARKVVQHFHPRADKRPNSAAAAQLTPRELEIVEQVAAGYSAKESAQRLKISVETVRTHLKRVYRKLQVGSGAAAVAKIYRE